MKVISHFFRRMLISGTGAILSLVILFTGGLKAVSPPVPVDEDTLISQLSVMSDVHMETFTTSRYRGFAQALKGLPAENNTLVLLGDNTMNGQKTEYYVLYGLLNRYGPKNTLVAAGNHDVRINFMQEGAGRLAISDANRRHMDFWSAHLNSFLDVPYYSRKIDGATVMVLASEQETEGVGQYFSDAQWEWILETVETAPADEPVIIFNHDPLPGIFGQSFSGAQGNELKDWLSDCGKEIILLSGHIHPSLSYVRTETFGGLTCVNVPAFMSNESPETTSLGFQVEIYPNEVVLRLRNFGTGEWIENKEFSVSY
ncbi:MAG: metallophosphoesterase [Oscillospiraceae bacterium]|nr:metallophosphoesterase [Oscillospiraceae bacterium]